MQDFPTAFHLTANVAKSSQQNDAFCEVHSFSGEWELPSTQLIDPRIEDIIYNNNTFFLLNTETFSIEIRSLSFLGSALKTSRLGTIKSEIMNGVNDQNVFFLVHEASSTFFIATKEFVLQSNWNLYDEAHASNNPDKEYAKITDANKVSGYRIVKELLYAYVYDNYFVASAAGEGLFIYDLSAATVPNLSPPSFKLIANYDAQALQLPEDTSILIIDTAYDSQYQLLYVLDKLNGIFVFDFTALSSSILLQKNDLSGGTNIEFRRGIASILIEEGRNRYLKEFFREYHDGKVKDHYLNRRLVLESGGGELWSDENYAYLMIEGFSYMYRIGVPETLDVRPSTDDYFNVFISIPFDSMTTFNYNHQSWVVTVGNGLLNAYVTKNYPAEFACNSTGVPLGAWIYQITAYQSDCLAVRDNEKTLSKPNSSYCIYSQKYTVTIGESSSFDQKKVGLAIGLGIGLFVTVLLFVVMCHLVTTHRYRAVMLQNQMNKFIQVTESEEPKGDAPSKENNSEDIQGDKFGLEKTDPGSVENRNLEPQKRQEMSHEKKKEAVSFGQEIHNVDEIYKTDEPHEGNP